MPSQEYQPFSKEWQTVFWLMHNLTPSCRSIFSREPPVLGMDSLANFRISTRLGRVLPLFHRNT